MTILIQMIFILFLLVCDFTSVGINENLVRNANLSLFQFSHIKHCLSLSQFIAVFFPHVFLSNLPLSVHIFLHLPRYPPWFIVIALYIPSSVHIYLSLFIPFYLDSYLLHYIKQAEVDMNRLR